jgi:Rab-GTPase-TBC domain
MNTPKIDDSVKSIDSIISKPKYKLKTLISKQLDPTDSTPLNEYEIKNYIYFGFSDAKLRPKYWKILLKYYSNNKFKSETYYKKIRQSYSDIIKANETSAEEKDEITKIIRLDLDRTMLLLKETKDTLAHYRDPIERILLTFSATNTCVGYVQGMINVVMPILHVMHTSEDIEDVKFAEEDTFFLFTNLMAEISENFIRQFDEEPIGIKKKIADVFDIIKDKDPELHKVICEKELDKAMFPFRWIMLLFSSEFKLEDVIWLWDRILSDSYRFEIVTYCCVAATLLMRNIIITEPFDKCMEVLQNPSIINVELMFDIADLLRREEIDVSKILKGEIKKSKSMK